MTFDLQAARDICTKINGRELFNAGCCTVAEMAIIPGKAEKEFCEVAHPEFCDWCEIIVFAVNSLPVACDEIARLDREVSVARNLASLAKGIVDEQAIRIKQLEVWLKEEKAQNLLNFQRHDEGETRSWDDLSEQERAGRIEFAGECLKAEDKL